MAEGKYDSLNNSALNQKDWMFNYVREVLYVKDVEGKGRGVFTECDLEENLLIIVERAIVSSVKEKD
jgi:hypothetical protein